MGKSASEAKIRDLTRQLAEEQRKHARTRAELQQENARIWRLVPAHYINLMGVYPPLRKLLHVLAEAADAQDPSRGAPTEDTMRTEYTDLTPTERGVITHWRARSNVRFMRDELEILRKRFVDQLGAKTAHFANVTSATAWEYDPPPRPVCHVKGCSARGRQQSYSAWDDGCEGCGRSFQKEAANG
jgi:hypothetical protein